MSAYPNSLPMDYRDAFASDMTAAGLGIADLPIDDGQLHRFYVEGDKSQSKNGWYCLFGDGVPAGSYGSWKTGEKSAWCAKSQSDMSNGEFEAHRKRIETSKRQRKAKQTKVYREAAAVCTGLWDRANPTVNTQHPNAIKPTQTYAVELWYRAKGMVADHPYAISKGIDWVAGAKRGYVSGSVVGQRSDCIIVPIRDLKTDGVVGIQAINSEGKKQTFGNLSGNAFICGNTNNKNICWYIVEGWADAISMVFHHHGGNAAAFASLGKGQMVKLAGSIADAFSPETLIILEDGQ